MIGRLLEAAVFLFPISEVTLAFVKRSRGRAARREDRGSMQVLWAAIALGVVLMFLARGVSWARLPLPAPIARGVALVLLAGGLAVRWAAILTLGRLFTVDVAIQRDHAVVTHGLYRYVRHPSYTGLLVAFLGLGVAFDTWIGLLGLMIPIVLGILYRVAKEERALREALGSAYAAYCARTRRFIPWLV